MANSAGTQRVPLEPPMELATLQLPPLPLGPGTLAKTEGPLACRGGLAETQRTPQQTHPDGRPCV
eukprot:5130663-Lingulodinium_polyedra.AAC.1